MDFSIERARTLKPDVDSEEWLLEIAWLYNRIVECLPSGSEIPWFFFKYPLYFKHTPHAFHEYRPVPPATDAAHK